MVFSASVYSFQFSKFPQAIEKYLELDLTLVDSVAQQSVYVGNGKGGMAVFSNHHREDKLEPRFCHWIHGEHVGEGLRWLDLG